jgi:hypothetical protein
MPKEKMKFPEVPGDTPREKFVNLVRHLFSVPKPVDKSTHKKHVASKTKSHSHGEVSTEQKQ